MIVCLHDLITLNLDIENIAEASELAVMRVMAIPDPSSGTERPSCKILF